jgi:hypothetical protein
MDDLLLCLQKSSAAPSWMSSTSSPANTRRSALSTSQFL